MPALFYFLIFVCVDALVLPRQMILKNDDFGYLDSVVRTLQEGHLIIGDFLEPFAVTLTSLSALFYKISQNIWFATYGLLFATHCALWWVLYFLGRRFISEKNAGLLATGILFFPLVFGKIHEFTSVPLYWTCFFAFILAWPKRPWLACCLLILAFGCRQSAVTLFILPLLSLLERRAIKTTLAVMTVAALGCILMASSLEPSFAQLNLTYKMRENFQTAVFLRSLVSFSLFAWAGAGVVALVRDGAAGGWRQRAVMALIVLVTALVLRPWTPWIGLDMVYLGALPRAHLLVFLGLGFFALFAPITTTLLRWNFVLLTLGMIVLPSLRGAVWDYYGVEIALMGALCIQPEALRKQTKRLWILRPAVLVYSILCLGYAVSLWRFHDLIALRIRLYEEAQRQGVITVREVSRAPFGYTGWKLFDTQTRIQKAQLKFRDLATFLCEMDEQASLTEIHPTQLPLVTSCQGATDPAFRIVHSVEGKVLWKTETLDLLIPCSYHISQQTRSQCLAPGEVLETKIFPLSNQEWSQLIHRSAARL